MGRVLGVGLYLPCFNVQQHIPEAYNVHGLCEAVPHRLEDQRMVRYLHVARQGIVLAGHLSREYRSSKVVGAHALDGRRHFATPGVPKERQRPGGVPPPSCAEEGGLQDGLGQHALHLVG